MRQFEDLVAPGRVAVLTMELQRGIVGDLSCLPLLAKSVAEAGVLANTARVLEAARGCGIPVIHCTAAFRPDRAGSFDNVPLVNQLLRNPDHLLIGSSEVEICPELRPAPSDLESQRLHGISPFHGTSLEPMLRSAGVTTVVATGVSLNVGIIGLTIEALNHGYHVVLPTDCVAAHPLDYGRAVIEGTLAQLTTQTTSADLAKHWR